MGEGSTPPDDGPSLTDVSTDDLRQIAGWLANHELPAGRAVGVLLHSYPALREALAPFRTLDSASMLAVVRAVLGERARGIGKGVDLVWSGSDSGHSFARYTKVVVPELIERATRQITIAGYSFDAGAGLFEHLRDAVQRGVSVRIFLDVDQLSRRLAQQLRRCKLYPRLQPLDAARREGAEVYAREVLGLFRELHWPFDVPSPDLFYDPRTAEEGTFASLHAKCLVVDHEHVLITSANFTGRGQDRNIEVGVVIRDTGYAGALEQQWNNLVASGDVVRG